MSETDYQKKIDKLEAENQRLRMAVKLVEDMGFPDFWYEPTIYPVNSGDPESPRDFFRNLTKLEGETKA